MAQKRRAQIVQPIDSEPPKLPSDTKLIEIERSPRTGEQFVIIEGPRLPRWSPGAAPQLFYSVEDALAFDPAVRG